MITLLKRLKALYLPFAYIIVSIVAVPIFAIEAIEGAEFIIAQVEQPLPAPPTPSSVTQAPATTATTPVDADPTCEIGDTTRNELCAQWKAADAATNAVYIGWGQLVVSAVTLLAAFAAAIYAKKAAREAASANQIATRTDRPWVFVDARLRQSSGFSPNVLTLSLELMLRNDGNTPAVSVYLHWEAFQAEMPDLNQEYERILRRPPEANPDYIEPFRTKHSDKLIQSMPFDSRSDLGRTVVAITVYYRSPHSDTQLHTTVFYYLSGSTEFGHIDNFVKAANRTRMA